MYIAEIALYEFIRGAKDPSEAKKSLEEEFEVIYYGNEIIEKAAEMWKRLRAAGRPMDDRDLLITATAIARGYSSSQKTSSASSVWKASG